MFKDTQDPIVCSKNRRRSGSSTGSRRKSLRRSVHVHGLISGLIDRILDYHGFDSSIYESQEVEYMRIVFKYDSEIKFEELKTSILEKQIVNHCREVKYKNGVSILYYALKNDAYNFAAGIIDQDLNILEVNEEGLSPLYVHSTTQINQLWIRLSKLYEQENISKEAILVSAKAIILNAVYTTASERESKASGRLVRMILNSGITKNIEQEFFEKALYKAAQHGGTYVIKAILDEYINFKRVGSDAQVGHLALIDAIRNGKINAVKGLVKNNVSRNFHYCDFKQSALYYAINSQDPEMLKALLIERTNREGYMEKIFNEIELGMQKVKCDDFRKSYTQEIGDKFTFLCDVKKHQATIDLREIKLRDHQVQDNLNMQYTYRGILKDINDLEKDHKIILDKTLYEDRIVSCFCRKILKYVDDIFREKEGLKESIKEILKKQGDIEGITLEEPAYEQDSDINSLNITSSSISSEGNHLSDVKCAINQDFKNNKNKASADMTFNETERFLKDMEGQRLIDQLSRAFSYCCFWHHQKESEEDQEIWNALPYLNFLLKKVNSYDDKCEIIANSLIYAYKCHGTAQEVSFVLQDGKYDSKAFLEVAYYELRNIGNKLMEVVECIESGGNSTVSTKLAEVLQGINKEKIGMFHKDIVEYGFGCDCSKIFVFALMESVLHNKGSLIESALFEEFCIKENERRSALESGIYSAVKCETIINLDKLLEVASNLSLTEYAYGIIFSQFATSSSCNSKLLGKVIDKYMAYYRHDGPNKFIEACRTAANSGNCDFFNALEKEKGVKELLPKPDRISILDNAVSKGAGYEIIDTLFNIQGFVNEENLVEFLKPALESAVRLYDSNNRGVLFVIIALLNKVKDKKEDLQKLLEIVVEESVFCDRYSNRCTICNLLMDIQDCSNGLLDTDVLYGLYRFAVSKVQGYDYSDKLLGALVKDIKESISLDLDDDENQYRDQANELLELVDKLRISDNQPTLTFLDEASVENAAGVAQKK